MPEYKDPKKKPSNLYRAKRRKGSDRQGAKDLTLSIAFNKLQPEELRFVPQPSQNIYRNIFNSMQHTVITVERGAILEQLGSRFPENPYTLTRLCCYYAATKHEKTQSSLHRLHSLLQRSNLKTETVQSILTRDL